MILEFDYEGEHYEIEILNPYYLPGNHMYPPEFDYLIGQVRVNGKPEREAWAPSSDLEQTISDMVYDRLMAERA